MKHRMALLPGHPGQQASSLSALNFPFHTSRWTSRLVAVPPSYCSSRGERLWVQISAPASAASYRSHFAEVGGHFLAWRPGLAPSPAIAHQRCLLAQPQWWFALVPACEQPVHGALVSDATQLLPLFFCPVRGTLDSFCGCGFGRS